MTTWIRHTPEAEALFCEERLVCSATELIRAAMDETGVDTRGLAALVGVRSSEIDKRLGGHRDLTLRDLARMMHVLGYELTLGVRRRSVAEAERAVHEAKIDRRSAQ